MGSAPVEARRAAAVVQIVRQCRQSIYGVGVGSKLLGRQIEAAASQVFANVSQEIRELHRHTELSRRLEGDGVLPNPEDVAHGKARGCANPKTVGPKLGPAHDLSLLDVGLKTIQQEQQVLPWDAIA